MSRFCRSHWRRRGGRKLLPALLSALFLAEQGLFSCPAFAEAFRAPKGTPENLTRIGLPPAAIEAPAPTVPVPPAAAAPEVPGAPLGLPQALLYAGRMAKALQDSPASVEELSLEPEPGRQYTPSPADWRDYPIYSLVVDRFNRSARGKAEGDPQDGSTWHGGDVPGITEKLDYIFDLGFRVVLPTPLTKTVPDAYHAYAPVNFLEVEPRFGTMEDVKSLSAQTHARGGYFILDWVLNHAGPVFKYKDEDAGGGRWAGLDGPAKEIAEWTHPIVPVELADPRHFTRRGVIEQPHGWNDENQAAHGDFPPNYRHFASDRPETQDILIKIAKWWIKETDADGMRLDAIRHVPSPFRERFEREVGAYAASLGKRNFCFVKENSTGKDVELAAHLSKSGSDTVYNYPAYRRDNWALHGQAPTRELEHSVVGTVAVHDEAASRLIRFIDGHDVYRFLRPSQPLKLLKLAYAFVMFSIGVPMNYYGTEQAFRQSVETLDPEGPSMPADPRNREDMFAGGAFKSESSAGDAFKAGSSMYKHVARLAELRRAFPALRYGSQWVRWSDAGGPGIYAFSRIHEDSEILVVLNTAAQERSAPIWVDAALTPAGSKLVDVLDPAYDIRAYKKDGHGSHVNVSVPARGVRVFVREP